jgi:hypothetical protein
MDTLRQAGNVQSSAYIGIAAILAVFILTFAIAPKARAQDKRIHSIDRAGNLLSFRPTRSQHMNTKHLAGAPHGSVRCLDRYVRSCWLKTHARLARRMCSGSSDWR